MTYQFLGDLAFQLGTAFHSSVYNFAYYIYKCVYKNTFIYMYTHMFWWWYFFYLKEKQFLKPILFEYKCSSDFSLKKVMVWVDEPLQF